jgi:hypothetical protein
LIGVKTNIADENLGFMKESEALVQKGNDGIFEIVRSKELQKALY